MPNDAFVPADSFINEDKLNFVFTDCPLNIALRQISSKTNVSFSIPSGFGAVPVSGFYKNSSLDSIVSGLASSANLRARFVSDSTILFSSDDDVEKITLTTPAPFMSSDHLRNDENINSVLVNGVLVCSGERQLVKDYVKSINKINNDFVKSYACEVNIVRVSRSVYADVAAELRLSTTNILTFSSFTDLVSLIARADLNFNRAKQVLTSYVYLTEGQTSSLDVGTVRQRELRNISNEGYTTTSGYKEFRDGLQLKLTCSAISETLYVLDTDVSQSRFRDTSSGSDVVPINDTSEVKSSRAIVADDKYCVLASLSDNNKGSGAELFGITKNDVDQMILVFAKVKRVNPSLFGSRVIDIIDIDSL